MRRGDPNFQFPSSSTLMVPEYFDKLGKPTEIAKFNGDANVAKLNLLVCIPTLSHPWTRVDDP